MSKSKREIAEIYAKNHLNFGGEIEYLGSGYYAKAFGVGEKVVKVTDDEHDTVNCNKLVGKTFKHLVNVHKVHRLKGIEDKFIIVSDKIEALNWDNPRHRKVSNYINENRYIIQEHYRNKYKLKASLKDTIDEFIEYDDEARESDREFLNDIREQIIYLCEDLKKIKLKNLDLHGENVGFLNGVLQMFDLGHKSSKGQIEIVNEIEL